VVNEEISEHRVAEGSPDERSHHRLSQYRAPLSQIKSAKDSGNYLAGLGLIENANDPTSEARRSQAVGDAREVLNGIFCVLSTACQWQALRQSALVFRRPADWAVGKTMQMTVQI
jgi:hypothetical protein